MQRRDLVPALLIISLGAALAPANAEEKGLQFGIISTESSMNLRPLWQPLLDDMHKATGLEVNAFFATDYAGVIEAMRFGKVQLAWLGNKAAMEAVDRAGGEIFARIVQLDGTPGYWSVMIVHKDSPLRSLDDVIRLHADLTLGLGDPQSTSGSLVPSVYAFEAHKINPARDFKRTARANHESNLLAVLNKHVDVATVSSDSVERMKLTHPQSAANLREIWRSPLIPTDPILWRKNLDAATKNKVRDFLLAYGKTEREKKILEGVQAAAFVASNDKQLIVIRRLELALERTRIERDDTVGTEEKTRRLNEIERKRVDLDRQASNP